MKTKFQFLLVGAFLGAVDTAVGQQPTFTKITTGDIVQDTGDFPRCAWGDFNNDGFLDLLVANWGSTNLFYRNNRDGTFTRIAQGDPVEEADYHMSPVWGDYDNDGNLDLLACAGASAPSARRNLLYHNNGDGTFSRASGGGLTNQLGFFNAAAWADYDSDGFLDVFITYGFDSNGGGGKCLLLHNNGDGTFTKVTAGSVVNDIGIGTAALWADYDNDGFMDLLVVNVAPYIVNYLYHNNGDGTFTRILTNTLAGDQWPSGAGGGAWGDYDNDGLLDLFITSRGGVPNSLYHNQGGGVFAKVASGPMLPLPSGAEGFGCAWGDYDNDGYLDLIITYANGKNGLFHNNGDGTFSQVLSGPPVEDGGPGINCYAASWVDYDNDGFLDLFITAASDSGPTGPTSNFLYHNNGNTNAWLEVNCIGTVANRSAIGTKVRVRATIRGKTVWQMREINNGGGFDTVPLVAHFGLGDATNVETLRIEWPSGTVQELHNVSARQILNITEPPRLLATMTNGAPQFFLKAWPGMQFDIQSSTDLRNWLPAGTTLVTNMNGIAQIVDTNAPALDQRFYRAVSN